MKRTSPLFLTAALLAAHGCAKPEAAESKPGGEPPAKAAAAPTTDRRVQVETETVEPRPFEDRVEITGNLEAVDDATLSAQSAGTVRRIAELGTAVSRGTVVASLDAELLGAAVKQAEAAVAVAKSAAALAEDNYRRQKPLQEEGVISALEFEQINAQRTQAQAQVTQAEAALAQARKQLSHARVTAPFAGVVEQRLVEAGEQVNPGQPILRVTNTKTMKVRAGMPERYAADIKKGAAIRVAFNAYGIAEQEARLTFVGSTINPQNRTFSVEAELDNPEGTLKPQMVARLLVTRSRIEDAITVPLAAVVRDETGEAVFVVAKKDGAPVAERRRVKTGVGSRARVVVSEGLNPGDEVVIAGQGNLTRGDKLEITPSRDEAQAATP